MVPADQTSARGLPWPVLEPQRSGRFNIGTQEVGFDVCRDEEGERRRVSRRLNMGDLTNRGIEATLEEMERELCDLKKKMRELTKIEGAADRVRGQGLRRSDREASEASNSDREDRRADQGELEAGSGMQKVGKLTGKSLIQEGHGRARERGETIVTSEPKSARLKCKSKSARDSSRK